MYKNTVKAVELSIFNSANLTGGFLPINPGGLTNACFLIRISNGSTVGAIVSFDGVIATDYIGAGDSLELSFQTNSGPNNRAAYLPQATVVYVTEVTMAGVGGIYLSGYYQPAAAAHTL